MPIFTVLLAKRPLVQPPRLTRTLSIRQYKYPSVLKWHICYNRHGKYWHLRDLSKRSVTLHYGTKYRKMRTIILSDIIRYKIFTLKITDG